MDILQTFGIQPVLLAAQIVNFLVLLFLLNKFLYKPILKVLSQRRQKIVDSLKNAEEIELQLQKTENDRLKKLAEATTEGKGIIEDAKTAAANIIAEAHQKAKSDIELLVAKAQSELAAEGEKLHQEIRVELADIVDLSLRKIASEAINPKSQKEIIQKAIKNL